MPTSTPWSRLRSMVVVAYARWCGLACPPSPPPYVCFDERERARRGRLTAGLLLGVIGWQYAILIMGFFDPSYGGLVDGEVFSAQLCVYFVLVDLLVVVQNRRGHHTCAALTLVAIAQSPLLAVVLFPAHGQLRLLHMPVFYLLVLSLLIAAAVLPPLAVFPIALVNSIEILGTVLVVPPGMALQHLLTNTDDTFAIFAQPIALQFAAALIIYPCLRTMRNALQRADLAEQIARGEHAQTWAQARALEAGVRRPLPIFALLANSTLLSSDRSAWIRTVLLWHVGQSLALLHEATAVPITTPGGTPRTLKTPAHAATREQEEAERLAIEMYRLGYTYLASQSEEVALTEDDVLALLRQAGPAPSQRANV